MQKSDFIQKITLILIGAFSTAIIGGVGSYISFQVDKTALKDMEKKNQIIKQLNAFYLPLKENLHQSKISWLDYKKRYKNNIGSLNNKSDLSRWQRYMLSVFQPIHVRLELIIKQRNLAIDSKKLNDELDLLVKHINQYKIIFSQWKDRDVKEIFAPIHFPKKLEFFVSQDIETLKKEKESLQ